MACEAGGGPYTTSHTETADASPQQRDLSEAQRKAQAGMPVRSILRRRTNMSEAFILIKKSMMKSTLI